MKVDKFRDQTGEELVQMFADTSRELLELKMKKNLSDSSVQPLHIKTLRRDLARIKTVQRERQIKIAAEAAVAVQNG